MSKFSMELSATLAGSAALCLRFGDLGLIQRHLPIVRQIPNWDRSKWPMQDAVRRDAVGKLKPTLVRYSDEDPGKIVAEYATDRDSDLLEDGTAAYQYMESILSKLLDEG